MANYASPVLYRTWQFQTSVAIAMQATVALTNGRALRLAKDAMTGTGAWTDSAGGVTASSGNWSVVSSSNGAGGFGNNDNVDGWGVDGDVVFANAGVNHSWIVLKQTGLTGTYYLCIDCIGGDSSRLDYAWSTNLFTGGTATARPTSVGEAAQYTTGYPGAASRNWGGPTANAASVMHVLKSTDGKATRIMWARNGWSSGLWLFDELRFAPLAVTSPAIAVMFGTNSTAPVASTLTIPNFTAFGVYMPLVQLNGTYPAYAILAANYYNNGNSLVTVPTVANDMAAAWPLLRVKANTRYDLSGGGSSTVNPISYPIVRARGEQGIIRDIWWAQSALGEADYAPAAGTRDFIIVGDMCLPWNTTVATMA